YSTSRHLDSAGIGPGRTWIRLQLVGHIFLFRSLEQPIKHERVNIWPTANHRPLAHLDLAIFAIIRIGVICSMGHIYRQRYVGAHAIAGSLRSAATNLFLRAGDRGDLCLQLALSGEPDKGFTNSIATRLVIKSTGNTA